MNSVCAIRSALALRCRRLAMESCGDPRPFDRVLRFQKDIARDALYCELSSVSVRRKFHRFSLQHCASGIADLLEVE